MGGKEEFDKDTKIEDKVAQQALINAYVSGAASQAKGEVQRIRK